MNRNDYLYLFCLAALTATVTISTLYYMAADHKKIMEAIAIHTQNAHIVVDRHHVITEEKAGDEQ